jgi:Ser/Thr protein kinase RdoA (MazF antagonist)
MSQSAWGESTRFFFELTPDRVLAAVEAAGLVSTGRCMALGSFENRVYDIELEPESAERFATGGAGRVANRVVAKFYRPGRWSREQILEEHRFLLDLLEAEIPAIAPLSFAEGPDPTLRLLPEAGIWYALFPKVGGRAPDELSEDQCRRIGRLLGRVHNVGATREAAHRIRLDVETYGRSNLDVLLAGGFVPLDLETRYRAAAESVVAMSEPLLAQARYSRVHGDCHLGNLLWNQDGPFFLDFDDMVMGPAVQDVWMLVPGRDAEALLQRDWLLEGYEEMRQFDRRELRLIEPLRALRFIHYSAWVARRWEDPAFPQAFPEFGKQSYWERELRDLEEQAALIAEIARPLNPA